jgi:hypothetical protein
MHHERDTTSNDHILCRLIDLSLYGDRELQAVARLIENPRWAAALLIFSYPPIAELVYPYVDVLAPFVDARAMQEQLVRLGRAEAPLIRLALGCLGEVEALALPEIADAMREPWTDVAVDALLVLRRELAVA